MITFNKPFIIGNELQYIEDAVKSLKISGDGKYSKKCQHYFEENYGFQKTFLTTSCTDALEMTSLLANIKAGDEVIMPSFTFVSTATPFVLRGANIKFADSLSSEPNIDPKQIEGLITEKTKAIVVVHYAGVACDMDTILEIANRHNITVIEDAAQAYDAFYKGKPLGSLGHMSTFSFHETKNIISGEGGLLCLNDSALIERAEVIREKGTNRSQFFRGEVDKYNWVDVGSSFLPSDILAAFLYAQLEKSQDIQQKRIMLWERYQANLYPIIKNKLPFIPEYASNNAHMYYLVCDTLEERSALISFLKGKEIQSVFHYQSLHKSPFYKERFEGDDLVNANKYTDCLVRLPLFYDLTLDQVDFICEQIALFYNGK